MALWTVIGGPALDQLGGRFAPSPTPTAPPSPSQVVDPTDQATFTTQP
jgi:hypothetical protein